MGLEEQEYKKAKMRVDNLNEQMGVNDKNLGLGYLDMNSRMLQIEKASMKDKTQWSAREAEHKRRKAKIEDYWHSSTNNAMSRLQEKIPTNDKGEAISRKKQEHYTNFTLKELEIVMKNNKNGKNSQEYNDVATDLELLNALEGNVEVSERLELLERLSESCQKYISTRNPFTPKGKWRRAMIEHLYSRIQAEKNMIKQNTDNAYKELNAANDLKQVSKETVQKVFEGKFALLSQRLKQSIKGIKLADMEMRDIEQSKEDKIEDKELKKCMEALAEQEVSRDQSPTLTTRFFNAIGWSKRTPKRSKNFLNEVEKSPVKVKLYHTIGAESTKAGEQPKDASGMIKQLTGETENSRQYMSYGNYGKGTYTAARGIDYQDDASETGDKMDQEASMHSWSFGRTAGSMQVTMTFNQNARIISFFDARALCNHFKKIYPECYQHLNSEELGGGYNMSMLPHAASIILAFYGYNTVYVPLGCRCQSVQLEDGKNAPIDYYVTFDRSAFTVDADQYGIRNDDDEIEKKYVI